MLIVGGESGSGNKIACEHTDQFIRTHYLEEGVFDSADLFFFEREAAETYAATLTESIPPCAAGPGFPTIPTASISIDGDSADWAGIDPVATDHAGDRLETSFSLGAIPDAARSMRFGPYTQSFGPLGSPLSHDEDASDCYLLPVLGDDRKKRILLYQRVLQSLPK